MLMNSFVSVIYLYFSCKALIAFVLSAVRGNPFVTLKLSKGFFSMLDRILDHVFRSIVKKEIACFPRLRRILLCCCSSIRVVLEDMLCIYAWYMLLPCPYEACSFDWIHSLRLRGLLEV
jgi:hypothetical protein